MSSRPLSFELQATDAHSQARAGVITTPHGPIQTPIFMPVGTQGAVRNLSPDQVGATGAQIILANTYHMSIRPGEDLVKKAGGLHKFMGYKLPILTDSGGFQVFSLPKKKIDDDGVRFQYELNGQEILLNPERSMEIQQALGADIAMVFDECAPYPCTYEYAVEALERTTRWERRSKEAHTRPDQALFGIVQGSVFPDLRKRSAREILDIGFDGYAIGGLSVGEGLDIMSRVLDWTVPILPEDKPRYLMGVGLPEDMLAAVERGIDMMDCVIPTRHARGGILYTFQGRMRIQHARYRRDMYPIDTKCTCYTCQNFSRAYLRHLFMIREVLANTLASIHNIHFYLELMGRARKAVLEGHFSSFKRQFLEQYQPGDLMAAADMLDDEGLESEDGDGEPVAARESSGRGGKKGGKGSSSPREGARQAGERGAGSGGFEGGGAGKKAPHTGKKGSSKREFTPLPPAYDPLDGPREKPYVFVEKGENAVGSGRGEEASHGGRSTGGKPSPTTARQRPMGHSSANTTPTRREQAISAKRGKEQGPSSAGGKSSGKPGGKKGR